MTADRLASALADRYRIERELGAGGMATVYLAQDLKHDRKVAIKVLKPELAAVLGADRFVVEIKTTASLQHPHILPLFDSGTADGFLFYVMPYIKGETIRAKLNRETLFGVDEAVRIAREVADALDYAHRNGVIHRDIKPENILLHDGRPMVMDFGIALAVSAAAGGRMTETGLSLGTPHYMSPEQATADRDLSARSDLYSLASVLYEMLAGQPPHIGGAAQQVIMKIITEQAAPVTTLRRTVPPNVEAAIARALEKLPADRFGTAREFAEALGDLSYMTAAVGARTRSSAPRRGVPLPMFGATAAIALIALAGLIWSLQMPAPAPDGPVVRTLVDLPGGDRLFPSQGAGSIAISPQGDRVAIVVQGTASARLVIRRTGDLAMRDLVAGPVGHLAFSGDGRWIAFAESNQISKVSVDGGSSMSLANIPSQDIRGLTWIGNDTILVGVDLGVLTLPSTGGVPRQVAGVDSTNGVLYPVVLADGQTIAHTVGANAATRRLAVTSLASRRTTVLDIAAASALGMLERHLLYVTSTGELNAVPFDLEQQRVVGDPLQLETGIRLTPAGVALASVSHTGSLWFASGQASGHLVRVDSRAEVRVLEEQHVFRNPRFSHNARTIAVAVTTSRGSDIWLYDLGSHTFSALTTDGFSNFAPEWSGDDRRVVFRSTRDGKQGIWWKAADGSGEAELLFMPDENINEAILSPDGKWLLYRTSPGKVNRDIFAVPLDGDRKPVLLVGGPSQESHPRLSPSGKWLLYQSSESGRYEVYVRPFPNPGARVQVSNLGGSEPAWTKSGTAVLYRPWAGGLESAEVTAGTSFTVGQRRMVLPPSDHFTDVTHNSWDAWPDDKSFLMVKPAGGDVRPTLVHNWSRTLREKLATGRP